MNFNHLITQNNSKLRIGIFTILTLAGTFLPATSYALFCPNNFNQINIGDSIDYVTQQCGAPSTQNTKDKPQEGPQEWSYFIPQTVSSDSLQQQQGTLKTSVTFDANDKAINISVNGIGVGSTTLCNSPIQLGATREQVKAACGKPSFIDKQNGASDALGQPPPPDKITTFVYGSGTTPATLTFENGKLTEKK